MWRSKLGDFLRWLQFKQSFLIRKLTTVNTRGQHNFHVCFRKLLKRTLQISSSLIRKKTSSKGFVIICSIFCKIIVRIVPRKSAARKCLTCSRFFFTKKLPDLFKKYLLGNLARYLLSSTEPKIFCSTSKRFTQIAIRKSAPPPPRAHIKPRRI